MKHLFLTKQSFCNQTRLIFLYFKTWHIIFISFYFVFFSFFIWVLLGVYNMNKWIVDSSIFLHPFNCILAAPTMGGKTFMMTEILKFKDVLIEPPPNRIIFCYKSWQPSYEKIKKDTPSIEFIEGILDTDIINIQNNNLIILDDLMSECINSEEIMNLFTVGSHHKNISVFFLTQNIFSKGKFSRDISLNSNYMIIFKNPRDQQQLQILARQMYPNNSKFLIESFQDATKASFGYLLLDLKQTTPHRNRVQTGVP